MARAKHRQYTVGVLRLLVKVEYDDAKALDRKIDYRGLGFYSLGDDGVYHKGTRATYSRIRCVA